MWTEYLKSYQNPEEVKEYIELWKKSKEILLENLKQEENDEDEDK